MSVSRLLKFEIQHSSHCTVPAAFGWAVRRNRRGFRERKCFRYCSFGIGFFFIVQFSAVRLRRCVGEHKDEQSVRVTKRWYRRCVVAEPQSRTTSERRGRKNAFLCPRRRFRLLPPPRPTTLFSFVVCRARTGRRTEDSFYMTILRFEHVYRSPPPLTRDEFFFGSRTVFCFSFSCDRSVRPAEVL